MRFEDQGYIRPMKNSMPVKVVELFRNLAKLLKRVNMYQSDTQLKFEDWDKVSGNILQETSRVILRQRLIEEIGLEILASYFHLTAWRHNGTNEIQHELGLNPSCPSFLGRELYSWAVDRLEDLGFQAEIVSRFDKTCLVVSIPRELFEGEEA